MRSSTPRKEDIVAEWHLIDAKDKVLGRVASDIAKLLIGKDKAFFSPHMNLGGKVVVINASEVRVTGNKKTSKKYFRHTGYPGGIKSESLGSLMERRPTEALSRAVSGMLPKNKHRKVRMTNLFIYSGAEHPHQGQVK
jgi:large subunit ribosomal protein L13